MKNRFLGRVLMAAALLAGTGIAGAATHERTAGSESDADIAKRLTHELRMYPRYSIWDDVSFRVVNGQLAARIRQPALQEVRHRPPRATRSGRYQRDGPD